MLKKSIQFIRKYCSKSVILCIVLGTSASAQTNGNRLFFSGSEIVVDVLPGNDIYYSHIYDKGITIYSLAEIFQVAQEKVLKENKLNPTQPINDGKIVKIPVNTEIIISRPEKKPRNAVCIPVYYWVKKGETLYKLSKQYFNIPAESLKQLNNKSDDIVKQDEKILLGWIAVKPKSDHQKSVQAKQGENKEQKNVKYTSQQPLKEEPKIISPDETGDADTPIVKYLLSDVIGMWDKNAISSKSYNVLHQDAKPGTMMDIYNPMLKKHVKAKVLGKIPEGTYHEDIQLIISPQVARDLGILDTRFKVNIKYEQ